MNHLKLLIIVLISISYSAHAFNGDAKKATLKGLILDSKTNTPVEYANVVLKHSSDSAFVNGTVSGNTGEFIITNLNKGEYYLVVSYIGYDKTNISGISIKEGENEKSVGTIKLTQKAVEIEAAQVVGEKYSEEFLLDKKVINVSQNINNSGGTALDVLQNQPSVSVDAEGNISIRGSSNFTVLVNGRPSVLQGNDALRQIAANTIDNIEIISNPSAKFDAEGASGIINIILKKDIASSLSGVANGSVGSRDKYNGDFTFSYNLNSTRLNGNVSGRRFSNLTDQEVDIFSNVGSSPVNNGGFLKRRDVRDQFDGRFGFEQDLSENSMFSLSGNAGRVDFLRNYDWYINQNTNGTKLYSLVNNKVDLSAKYFNTTLYYNWKIEPKIDEISLEAIYTNVNLPSTQLTDEFKTDDLFKVREPNPKLATFLNNVNRNEGRIKLDYTHNFDPKIILEAGLQTNLSIRNIDNSNTIYDWSELGWKTDPVYTNKLDFKNNVYSSYIKYSNSFSDIGFQLGLRAEYTDRLMTQISMAKDYKYEKLHLFPSGSISTKLFGDHQVQLSYSRRINRPHENLLNPYPFWNTSYAIIYGNPDLKPEFINSFELNYQKQIESVFLSVQTYFRKQTDMISEAEDVDASGKYISYFSNFASSKTYGAEISASYSPAVFLRFDPAVNLYNNELLGSFGEKEINSEKFTWNARLNANLFFSKDTRFMITGFYTGRQQNPQSEIEPMLFLNLTLRQDLFDKTLSLTLQARNLLNTSNYDYTTFGSNFSSRMLVKPEKQVITLNISYNFNSFKRTGKNNEGVDINVGP
jgi:outer membrane receptor protein involved in Fe transport